MLRSVTSLIPLIQALEARLQLSGGAADFSRSTTILSEARWLLAATASGSKAIFAGGAVGYGVTDAVDIYDAKTGQWSTAALSQARAGLAATSIGSKAFFAGGDTAAVGWSTAVDIYDVGTGSWSTAALSKPRFDFAAVTVDDKALFVGGTTPSDIYNARTGHWSTAKRAQNVSSGPGTAVGERAIFLGIGPTAQAYNAENNRWSSSPFPPEASSADAATTVGTKALFAGGGSDGVAIYDAVSGRWTIAQLSQARYGMAATAVGSKAIFAGGYFYAYDAGGAHRVESDAVDVYDARTGQWTSTTLLTARDKLAAAGVGDKAIFAGGEVAYASATDAVDVFTDNFPSPSLVGIVTGSPPHKATIAFRNDGDADLLAGSIIAVYASKPRTLDANSILLGQLTLSAPLAAGSSITVSVPISLKNVPAGQYHLVAAVDDHSGSGPTPIASQANTFKVAAHAKASPAAAHPFALRAGLLHGWPVGG